MLADGDGLWLCIRPTGAKSWISRTKKAGVMREKSLGDYPSVSLSDARKLHADLSKSVRAGVSRDLTFGDAFGQWLSHYAKTPSISATIFARTLLWHLSVQPIGSAISSARIRSTRSDCAGGWRYSGMIQ